MAPPPALEAGNIRVKADEQGHEEGHSWFRGSCDMQFGDMRINGDQFDFYMQTLPDGTETRRLVATGNVVFMQGDERLAGTALDMDLNTGKGTFDHPYGYVTPGLLIEGKTLKRLDPMTYWVDDPTFTSCFQPNPRWSFRASSAKIKVGKKITAFNTLMRVKSVPTPVFFPYFSYPISRDGRGTGLLFPKFGFGANKGFEVGLGFFWAMGRSVDQTFLFDNYSAIGYGFGHEFRYVGQSASRGVFNTYFFNQKQDYLNRPAPGKWDYDIEANANQLLPGTIRFNLRSREYSSLGFQQRFQESVNIATNRNRYTQLTLSRGFGGANLSAVYDRSQTFYGETRYVIRRHVPTVRLRQGNIKFGKTGIVGNYEVKGEGLENGEISQRIDTVVDYNRFDINPEISRPTSLSFLQLTPRFRYRATRYSASYGDDPATEDVETDFFLRNTPIDRRYWEFSTELRGPNFSRVFGGIGSYSDKIKHVIGPEFTYQYRPGGDIDPVAIPRFDGDDYTVGTNQITYGIYQTLLAKRPSPSGKRVPYEFLSWRLLQTYYGDISQGAQNNDPSYVSSPYGTTPEGKVIHTSPIQSRIRFRPVPSTSTDFSVEYDPNFKAYKSIRLSQSFGINRFNFDVGFYKNSNLRLIAEDPTSGIGVYRSGTARASLTLIPNKLVVDARADYDFQQKRLFNAIANFKYNVQCCGIGVQMYQKGLLGPDGQETWGFKFNIELANISGLGGNGDRGGSLTRRNY